MCTQDENGNWVLCKPCSKCGEHKRPSDHYTDRRSPIGKTLWCKVCVYEYQKVYRKEHPEIYAASNRRFAEKSRAAGRCSCGREVVPNMRSCSRCQDNARKTTRRYHREHPEKTVKRCGRWRETHRDAQRKIYNDWATTAYHTDPVYKAAHLIRTRVGAALRKWMTTGEIIEPRDGIDLGAIIRSLGDPPAPGWGKGVGMWTVQHRVPLRKLDLVNDPIDLAVAWDPENVCWELWETNRQLGNKWTPEVEELYQRLRRKHVR